MTTDATAPADTSKFVWDAENVLTETNQSGTTQAVYTLEPAYYGNLVAQRRTGTTALFHFDALGSTNQVTTAVRNVLNTYLY